VTSAQVMQSEWLRLYSIPALTVPLTSACVRRGAKEPCAMCSVPALIVCNMGSNIAKRFGFSDSQGRTLCRNCFTSLAGAVTHSTPGYSIDILNGFDTRITACAHPTVKTWEELVIFLKKHAWRNGHGLPVGRVMHRMRAQLRERFQRDPIKYLASTLRFIELSMGDRGFIPASSARPSLPTGTSQPSLPSVRKRNHFDSDDED
jgi:hypothetical protein